MVKDSLDAFVKNDVAKARAVCENDDVIDGLEDQINRELLTYMMEDARNISQALQLSMVAKNLERIADLSTNIGEEVIYMVEAKTIKHHYEDVHIKK
ncbi:MAG: phosphate uptake regulator PhoU [bacterium]